MYSRVMIVHVYSCITTSIRDLYKGATVTLAYVVIIVVLIIIIIFVIITAVHHLCLRTSNRHEPTSYVF